MLFLLLACCTSTTLFGCAQLFRQSATAPTTLESGEAPVQRDTIVLDIALADRGVSDSLTKLLWDDVDEIGVLDVERKRLLNENGFRVGVAGSSVPSALQTILRDSEQPESQRADWNNQSDQLPGSSTVTLFNNQDTLFEVSANGEMRFIEVDKDGEPIGDATEYEFSRCIVRLTAERMQEGWIKLRFLPEIHHGAKARRAMVGDDGLQFKKSQQIEKLYRYQFEVTLNPGEIAIVGASDVDSERPGHCFFSNRPGSDSQKLITVRFMETASVVGVRDSTVLMQ